MTPYINLEVQKKNCFHDTRKNASLERLKLSVMFERFFSKCRFFHNHFLLRYSVLCTILWLAETLPWCLLPLVLFQKRAAAAARCGSRACRPRSWCHPPTSHPLPWEIRRGVATTATWASTLSLTTSRRSSSSSNHTNTRSIINRRLSTIRLPWITSVYLSILHSCGEVCTVKGSWLQNELEVVLLEYKTQNILSYLTIRIQSTRLEKYCMPCNTLQPLAQCLHAAHAITWREKPPGNNSWETCLETSFSRVGNLSGDAADSACCRFKLQLELVAVNI